MKANGDTVKFLAVAKGLHGNTPLRVQLEILLRPVIKIDFQEESGKLFPDGQVTLIEEFEAPDQFIQTRNVHGKCSLSLIYFS